MEDQHAEKGTHGRADPRGAQPQTYLEFFLIQFSGLGHPLILILASEASFTRLEIET